MAFANRIIVTTLLGNLGGAILTFVYFSFVDPSAHEGMASVGLVELAYFAVCFTLLFVLGRIVAMRWLHPVIDSAGPLPGGPAAAAQRRRALLVPAYLALISFAGWVAAAFVWGVAWPLLTGTFMPERAARTSFGIIFASGTVVTVFIFLATERIWRERLPQLFPRGDLAAAGAARLRVRTRLFALFLLMSILPMAVLSVATLVRAYALLGADTDAVDVVIRNLIVVEVVLGAAALLVASRLAGYVADSVAQPLRHLQAAMARVAQGQLDVQCAVVSNDELGAVTEGFNRMVDGLREREAMREAFGRYVSPEVRDEILAGRISLAGSLREVTILFADLRDFTPWVESSPASEVVASLNEYFSEMDAAIRAHGGLVLQFIGDEIEAVFGAPIVDPHHADHAVDAALDMQSRLAAWNTARRAASRVELQHGIGVHSGTVLAGNVGSSERVSYSLVGDAVNVASRIQSLNKDFGTCILVSGATRALLAQPRDLRSLQAVRVKGHEAEVDVYALA